MELKKLSCFFILLLQLCTFQPFIGNAQQHLGEAQDSLSIQKQFSLTGYLVTGRIVALKYTTMPGNNPKQNKNWVGIWQGSQVLYDSAPLRKKYISDASSDGDLAFDSLEIQNKEYIIGYGSGANNSTVAATLYLKADIKRLEKGLSFSSTVEVIDHGNNYLIIQYQTPIGNIPMNNKNWVGVWSGKTFAVDGNNLIKRQNVNDTVSGHVIAVNDLKLVRDTWYTITYGVGPLLTDIIATYTFLNN
jgi:hypothetical protein